MSSPEDEAVVELRRERSGRDTRSLWARMSGGSLTIEGLDTGPAVQGHWGSADYEWALVISAEDVPALVRCLRGEPGRDDPLRLLEARYAEDPRCVTKAFLDEHGVPSRLWSWNSG